MSLKYTEDFISAIRREMVMVGEELKDEKISTIYLGGGTPSVLTARQYASLMELLGKTFNLVPSAEITIEANPDDLNREYLKDLRDIGFNRISIGVQSFFEDDLAIMRRSHNVIQAKKSIEDAYEAGFRNTTIDLIYGIPGLTNKKWETNLKTAFKLQVQHLSAYHLTFEPGTVFDHWRKKGRLIPAEEETSLEQYRILRELAAENRFIHYEISNFAKEGFLSRHNMIYWNRNHYYGLGPSAHSFNGVTRRWNVASLKAYISAILSGNTYYETETPDEQERYHDYIITSLRTKEGLDKYYVRNAFSEMIVNHFLRVSQQFICNGELVEEDNRIFLTPESWFISDHIMRELFLE